MYSCCISTKSVLNSVDPNNKIPPKSNSIAPQIVMEPVSEPVSVTQFSTNFNTESFVKPIPNKPVVSSPLTRGGENYVIPINPPKLNPAIAKILLEN